MDHHGFPHGNLFIDSYPLRVRHQVMSLEDSRRSQRPYRYGMVLLCVGALINWLGLAENYVEPVRYIGVACIIAGALLICTAMCCWLHSSQARDNNQTTPVDTDQDSIHVITIDQPTSSQKPPDYDTVAGSPPSYDDAIKLDPAQLLQGAVTSPTLSQGFAASPAGAGLSFDIQVPGSSVPDISPSDTCTNGVVKPPATPPPAYNALTLGDR